MRVPATAETVDSFIDALGRCRLGEGRIYLVGGSSAVLHGWRETTIDIDLKAEPEPAGFFQAIPAIKDSLSVNVELASPDQFIPPLPGWESRSPFIRRSGKVDFHHFDFYSQALAKIERHHDRDRRDVEEMEKAGLIKPDRLWEFFIEIETELIRYPAVDPVTFRARVAEVANRSKNYP